MSTYPLAERPLRRLNTVCVLSRFWEVFSGSFRAPQRRLTSL